MDGLTVDRRTLLTFSTAACLCGMCEAYALFVGPMFSRSTIGRGTDTRDPRPVPPKPPENRRQAEKYLGESSWACDSKYQFRTDAGFFYFQEWEKIEESGDVRFEPFAMIWRPKGHDPQKDPYTIVSDSALVKFAEKFEVTNPQPGRVVGGALEGQVLIRGPDGLLIDGQNFNFAEAALRVWSDHAVKFRQGPHSGRGQGLELKLIPSLEPVSDDKPAVSGVSSVRLLKDVKMTLVSAAKSGDKPAETVFVDSQGSFEFDVVAHVATYQKDVVVNRPTGKGQSDRLTCEELTLVFEPEEAVRDEHVAGATETPHAADGEVGSVGGNLSFRRLRAEGPIVTVVSERSEMQGRMNELTYDAQARVIALRDAKQVRLVQRNNELFCPEITAVLDEGGEIDRVICRGAGKLFSYPRGKPAGNPPPKRTPLLAAEWKKQLQKIPDPRSGLDLIEFEGRAVLNQAGKMSLQGDIVRIWVTPQVRKPGGAARSADPSLAGDDREDAEPKRMLALREVAFASPKISGRTDRLEIWFEEGSLPTPPMAQDARSLPHKVLRHDAVVPSKGVAATRGSKADSHATVGSHAPSRAAASRQVAQRSASERERRSGQSFAAVGDDNVTATAAAKEAPPDPETRRTKEAARDSENPLSVTADLIRVRALRQGGDTEIAEVITLGHVHVVQEHKSGQTPLDLTGEKLHLWNYSELNQVVDVSGRPAQVQDRGMQIEGPEVHFDRGQNLASVAGAGVLRLPMTKDLQGNALETSQMLDVFWQEKMEFDGEVAKFYEKVRTQLGGSEMRCESMDVTFAHRVSFSDDAPESQQTEVKLLVCRDGVEMRNNEYKDNKLVGVRTAKAFEFTINRQNGRTTAQGPGTLIDWRRGNGKRAGLAPSAGVRANGALAAESVEWEFTRIDFAGRMDGNIDDRFATFYDRVRVVYGPVAHSTDTIDEDSLPKDGGWIHCNRLQLTQHPETKRQPAYIEMEATGNTELEGRTFHAMAHLATYDESKGLYVLTGDGKRNAKIWQQKTPGAEPSATESQRLYWTPARNELKADGVVGIQGSR